MGLLRKNGKNFFWMSIIGIIFLIALLFLILLSSVISLAQENRKQDATDAGITNLNISQIIQLLKNPEQKRIIEQNLDKFEMPPGIKSIFGNDKVNLELVMDTGDVENIYINAEGGKIKELSMGHKDDATISVKLGESTVKDLANSNDKEDLKDILKSGDIEYKGETFFAKVKLFFLNIAKIVLLWFI